VTPVPTTGSPPGGVRTVAPASPGATRLVLVRHGEARCNVTGVCGGRRGCTGLTERGVTQVAALRDRLLATGELAGAGALVASELPRAVETAELLAPSLGTAGGGEAPEVVRDCDVCELHPGEADGMAWDEFSARFGDPDWDAEPDRPIAPGGESWTGFVRRVDAALRRLAAEHSGELVVVASHAGVVEASLLTLLPVAGGRDGARLQLRTGHASLTTWELDADRWRLLGYNDTAHLVAGSGSGDPGGVEGARLVGEGPADAWVTAGRGGAPSA
jgi:probable phosphoglycerate mutase